jgi:serine/threonine protein kinase
LDFKLENAILMPSEQNANVKSVKIIDFGAARIVPSYFGPSRNINQSVRIVERIYTTIYAAPEYAMMDHVC